MEGTLIAFRLASYDKDQASELVKRLYGQRTSSHGGKYVYRRKGLLDEIPHVRLVRGAIVDRAEDAERIMRFPGEDGAEAHGAQTDLAGEDGAALRLGMCKPGGHSRRLVPRALMPGRSFRTPMTRICIVGTGHVGLVYAVAFTLQGHTVVGADVVAEAIASLKAGKPTFYEPGLQAALAKARKTKRLSFSTEIAREVAKAEAVFLAVGTPSREDGSIDTSYVEAAARTVGEGMRAAKGYQAVTVKSTVVPGTTEGVARPALEAASGKRAGRDFGLCMNPEFLREGSAVEDALKPDRIVIGSLDKRSGDALARVYAKVRCRKLRTDLRTAEMIKYATNSFLATKVSFANELANLCDAFGGIDVDHVVEGMGLDARINPRFLKAGLGFGGSCFPKDVRALLAAGRAKGYDSLLLRATLDVNDVQPDRAVALAEGAAGDLNGKRVAILGLSFKGGSDDIRESRAVPLARKLLVRGARVVGYDPEASNGFHAVVPDVEIAPSVKSALADADVCIVHNDWPQWRALKAKDFRGMRQKVVVDGRRILRREALRGIALVVLGG